MLPQQPFFRKCNATWYVQLGKQQIKLGKDERAAYQKYCVLLAKRGQATNAFKTVAELLDAHLEWLDEHRAKATYDKTVYYLSHFARFIGKNFPISQIAGIHVTLWIAAQKAWSSSTGLRIGTRFWTDIREYSPFSVAHGPDFQVGTRRRRVLAR